MHKLELPHHVTIVLSHPDDDDDAGEEALTAPAVAIRLDIRQSAAANARNYYTAKKAAAAKTAKTVEAMEGAVKVAEKKAKASVAAIKVNASIRAIRSAFWFEKFAWCARPRASPALPPLPSGPSQVRLVGELPHMGAPA